MIDIVATVAANGAVLSGADGASATKGFDMLIIPPTMDPLGT
jgi:hypothetical protein